MAYKWYNKKTFEVDGDYSLECKSQRTNYGYRQLATLVWNGAELATGKTCIYNRPWEKYTYQSAIFDAIKKADLSEEGETRLLAWAEDGKEGVAEDMVPRKAAGMAALMGDLLCSTTEEKNAWKKRMIGTIPGVAFPDDFDLLTEEEKQNRLDGAIELL